MSADDRNQLSSRDARRDRFVDRRPGRQSEPDPQEGEDGRAPRVAWVPLGLAACIDLVVLALVALGDGHWPSYLAAAAVHMVAVAVVFSMGDGLGRSRRVLTASLVLALPLSGVAVALIALGTQRRAGLTAAVPDDDVEAPALHAACFQKIAEALSPCEVLWASGNEERLSLIHI